MLKRIAAFTACAVVFLFMGVGLAREPQAAQKATVQTASPNGRYQIVISPHLRADTFLLDTQTGRIWLPTQYSDLQGEPTVWEPQDRVDNITELRAWLGSQVIKKSGTRP